VRELNARTAIGSSRWSVDGLRDLLTVQLARTTDHPTWVTLRQLLRSPNAIAFSITTAKFNAG